MENVTSNSLKYEPKFGRVLIKRELKKSSLIHIPESAAKRNAPAIGVIVALGETAGWTETYAAVFTDKDIAEDYQNHDGRMELVPIQTLKVGQRIIFGRHAGAWLDGTSDEDATLYICQDQDILAVINE